MPALGRLEEVFMSKIRRPSHATVVAYLALVVALGTGGAWAAGEIRSKDIAKNAVRTKHIRAGAVTAKKLAHGGTLYGRAPAAADQRLILSWPKMGLRVRTGDTDVPDGVSQVRIVNANPPNGASFSVTVGGSITPIEPGASAAFGALGGVDARVVENGGAGRMVRLDCFANVIFAGDDGFMQCAAFTAGPK